MKLCLLLILTTNFLCATTTKNEDIPNIISNEVNHLKTSKHASSKLVTAIRDINKIRDGKVSTNVFCHSCHVVIGQIIGYRKSGANRDSMIEFLRKLCNTFTDWGAVACDGYTAIEIDTILYIIDNKKGLTPERACAVEFQHKGCTDPQANNWSIEITPLRHGTKHHLHQQPRSAETPPWKVLHLTDFHYDPLYQPGYEADCGVPLCCQVPNGPAKNPKSAAGYWGDYHVCDTPWHSITDFMLYVSSFHKQFDFVYYTGDIISHRSWATSKNDNEDAIRDLFALFKETFKETPLYPVLGNHEPHPTDFYSPSNLTNPKISTRWIFDLVANEWGKWLPNDTQETIRMGGYYTVLVKPGFRIVALNSNVCFISNLWLIYDDEDPYGQLKWLVEVLTEAEKNGERVHILSHIPPGEVQCLQQWSYQFRRIVDRFAPIISAQFNGHTHLDELRLFHDVNNTQEVKSVAFNAGSFTTFVALNPNYRVYDVDQTNYTVLDYDHYTYNLTEANRHAGVSPQWYKLYSFKEAYGLQDMTLQSLTSLIKAMSKDRTLLQKYFKFQVRDSDPQIDIGCNDQCLDRLLCSITAVEATSALECQQKKKSH